MGLCMVFRLHAETYKSEGYNPWCLREYIQYWKYVFLLWNSADLQSIMLFQFWIKGNWSSERTMEYYWSAKVLLSRTVNWWDASEFFHIKFWARTWHDVKCMLASFLSVRISRGALWPVSFPFYFFLYYSLFISSFLFIFFIL